MPRGASLRVQGQQQMAARLREAARRFPVEVERALFQEAEVEAKEAKRRTPVDTGNLRDTIHVQAPERDWRTISVAIVAGGPAAPYAVYVHEDLEAFHKVGQAKFLESVVYESAPFMAARVARRLQLNRVFTG